MLCDISRFQQYKFNNDKRYMKMNKPKNKLNFKSFLNTAICVHLLLSYFIQLLFTLTKASIYLLSIYNVWSSVSL